MRFQQTVICLAAAIIWTSPRCLAAAAGAEAEETRSAAENEFIKAYEALRGTPQPDPWGPKPGLSPGPSLSGLVPRATRTALQQFKGTLSAVVSEIVTSDDSGPLSPEEVRLRVAARLDKLGVKVPLAESTEATDEESAEPTEEREVRFPYAEFAEIKLATTPNHPEFVVLAPVIGTGAGADMPVYLFHRRDNKWRLLLSHDDSGDYDEISSDHDLALSPPDSKGSCFVVAIKLTGGLNSSMGSLSYKVLRPGREPRSAKTLVRGTRSARRMFDPPEIRTQSDGFDLEFISSALDRQGKFDPDMLTATRLLRFKVDADRARIVARKQMDPEFDIPASADK